MRDATNDRQCAPFLVLGSLFSVLGTRGVAMHIGLALRESLGVINWGLDYTFRPSLRLDASAHRYAIFRCHGQCFAAGGSYHGVLQHWTVQLAAAGLEVLDLVSTPS